jgi:hypothetical protein
MDKTVKTGRQELGKVQLLLEVLVDTSSRRRGGGGGSHSRRGQKGGAKGRRHMQLLLMQRQRKSSSTVARTPPPHASHTHGMRGPACLFCPSPLPRRRWRCWKGWCCRAVRSWM